MRVRMNPSAAALARESELIALIARRASASGTSVCRIAIRNDEAAIRVVVEAASEAEEEATTILLADAGYNDELLVDQEIVTGQNIEYAARLMSDPNFDCIYSRSPPRIERIRRAPQEDPGPDPSWILWYEH